MVRGQEAMGESPCCPAPRQIASVCEVTSIGRCPSYVSVKLLKLAKELYATPGKRSPECYLYTVEVGGWSLPDVLKFESLADFLTKDLGQSGANNRLLVANSCSQLNRAN